MGHRRDSLAARRVDYGGLSWQEARKLDSGEATEEIDWDERMEEEARQMATSIAKAIGRRGSERIEAFARALELYNPRIRSMLQEVWAGDEDAE